jgi:hypothetical protein
MTPSTTTPVTITPEAAERIAELGCRAEFEQMLEKLRQLVPELRRVEVWLTPPCDETGNESGVQIDAFRGGPVTVSDPAGESWRRWKIEAFSPDVWRHFHMDVLPETAHAG